MICLGNAGGSTVLDTLSSLMVGVETGTYASSVGSKSGSLASNLYLAPLSSEKSLMCMSFLVLFPISTVIQLFSL